MYGFTSSTIRQRRNGCIGTMKSMANSRRGCNVAWIMDVSRSLIVARAVIVIIVAVSALIPVGNSFASKQIYNNKIILNLFPTLPIKQRKHQLTDLHSNSRIQASKNRLFPTSSSLYLLPTTTTSTTATNVAPKPRLLPWQLNYFVRNQQNRFLILPEIGHVTRRFDFGFDVTDDSCKYNGMMTLSSSLSSQESVDSFSYQNQQENTNHPLNIDDNNYNDEERNGNDVEHYNSGSTTSKNDLLLQTQQQQYQLQQQQQYQEEVTTTSTTMSTSTLMTMSAMMGNDNGGSAGTSSASDAGGIGGVVQSSAPPLSFTKYVTMQERRVVVTIRYTSNTGLKPYCLTVAKKLKSLHPDLIIEKKALISENDDDRYSVFEVCVDNKVIIGTGNSRGSSYTTTTGSGGKMVGGSLSGSSRSLGRSSISRKKNKSGSGGSGGGGGDGSRGGGGNGGNNGGGLGGIGGIGGGSGKGNAASISTRSVFVSMQELNIAIQRARRKRRPNSTLYGENINGIYPMTKS